MDWKLLITIITSALAPYSQALPTVDKGQPLTVPFLPEPIMVFKSFAGEDAAGSRGASWNP